MDGISMAEEKVFCSVKKKARFRYNLEYFPSAFLAFNSLALIPPDIDCYYLGNNDQHDFLSKRKAKKII